MTVTIATRQYQLVPLTHEQVDTNFINLAEAVNSNAGKLADLAGSTGSTLIGNGGETVADSFNALQLADYMALRAYVGPRKSVYVTGYVGSAAPSGIAGMFVRDDSDTASADNSGTIIVSSNGVRWKRQFNGRFDVQFFGATGDGITDDTSAIQAAINAAYGELWFTMPVYLVAGQIVWKNNIIYRGCGINIFAVGGTKINFTATTQDASKIVNPINTSTPANISFRDLYLYAPDLQSGNAVLADTGSSYVTISGCRLYSAGDCLHMDQSELWRVENTSFLLANSYSVGAWLINGPDKTPGALPYFTNRITFAGCDFNGPDGSTHIRDDGGVSHSLIDNNHSGGGNHVVVTGVNGFYLKGGEYESSSGPSLIFGLTKRNGGAGAKSPVVSVDAAYFYNQASQPILALVAGSVGSLSLTDNTVSTSATHSATGLAVGCDRVHADNNERLGASSIDTDINNVIDVIPAAVGWIAATTSPSIGNGTIQGDYSRRGKLLTLSEKVVFGSTTTPGVGGYLFPLQFAANPNAVAKIGSAFIIIPGVGFYSASARVTDDGLNIELYTTNNTVVGGAAPATWVSGSTIEFQIEYSTLDPI